MIAASEDQELISEVVMPLMGKVVELSVLMDGVTLQQGQGSNLPEPSSTAASTNGTVSPPVAVGADVSAAGTVLPIAKATVSTCGAKAATCGELATLSQTSSGSKAPFSTPAGCAIPFGTLQSAVEAAGGGVAKTFHHLLTQLDSDGVAALEGPCSEMQALVAGLSIDPKLLKAVQASFDSDARLMVSCCSLACFLMEAGGPS